MKFRIHKCGYWKHEFVHRKGEDVTLENFNLFDEAIPQFGSIISV